MRSPASQLTRIVTITFAVATVWVVVTKPTLAAELDPPDGFRPLFNGADLNGWHGRPHYDPRKLAALAEAERKATLDKWWVDTKAHWRVEKDELVNDGKGPYLTTDAEFGDFELLLEYKTVAKADSGIYLRGNPQVQIWDFTKEGGKWNRGADKGSGGLFNNAKRAPGQEPAVLADKPFGQWNQFRIRQIGARTDVWLNGKLVVDHAVMENYWNRAAPHFRRGPIQLQTHGGEIRWRNVFLREIGSEEANQLLRREDKAFKVAFNGKDLTGWQGDVNDFQIVKGAVLCKPGRGGNLFTKDEYSDFVARMEFQLPPGGNNGLAIRFSGKGRPHVDGMCEIQVLDNTHAKYAELDPRQYHGSAYGISAAHRGFLRPVGEWNYQEVRVVGSTIRVELNGYPILDTDVSKVKEFKDGAPPAGFNRKSGFFGFAGHNDPVAFRRVDIKRLDAKTSARTSSWPQFRGRNSSGLAAAGRKLPEKIGPDAHVVWQTSLPPGHSSPAIHGDRIYLTAVDDGKLKTIAVDRQTGEILWSRVAPHRKLEQIHGIGSYSQCTPATDGDRVVSFFGSAGVFCYDRGGELLWNAPMGPFNNGFGAGTSPIIAGDRVIIVQDHDTDSFLLALDKNTGEQLWKTDRSEFPRNYCSPVLWENGGKTQIVVAATLRVVGYDIEQGREQWTVRGLSRNVCMTPVVGDNQHLYVAGWARGGDVGDRINMPAVEDALRQWDADKDGEFARDEFEKGGDIEKRFLQIDRDKSGKVTQREYVYYGGLFANSRNVVMAIRPGGSGDLSDTNIVWEHRRYLPFCSSPLYVHGYLFTVADGGIVTSLNATTGEPIKTARVRGTKAYFASAVAGDNKIYVVDRTGHLTVISSYAEWKVLHDVKFDEDVFATPAIVDGRIYLRTHGQLYCFAN
ncbi:MAG: DUF1080 domain-containing protein [Pirellulaceae bacterium]|nr:DUF1080 domain-containing protein [Pirellulaceae bacterium]MDP7018320.1 DUF1080 domain-containing protein [Pirellulaceae bacterium]